MVIRYLDPNASEVAPEVSPAALQNEINKLMKVPRDQMCSHLLQRMKDDPTMFSHLIQRMKDEEFLPSLLNLLLDITLPPSMLRPDLDTVPRALVLHLFWGLILAARSNINIHELVKGREEEEKEEGKK